MSTTEFTPGDVFLFEHDSSCISRLISALTRSPVSHAAMFFKEGMLIEEASPTTGIRTTPVETLQNADRLIHVRRYYRSGESAQALIAAAQKHLDAKQPYSLGNLVMVGVLLVFREWRPNARPAVKDLLSLLCILIAQAIDARINPGQAGAACSQLVYELYRDAGFRLNITHPATEKVLGTAAPQTLIMQTLAEVESGNLVEVDTVLQSPVTAGGGNALETMEKLSCVVLAALENRNVNESVATSSRDLLEVVARFVTLLHRFAHPVTSENKAFPGEGWIKRALQYVIEHYSGFVSPGDLYAACPDIQEEVAVLGHKAE